MNRLRFNASFARKCDHFDVRHLRIITNGVKSRGPGSTNVSWGSNAPASSMSNARQQTRPMHVFCISKGCRVLLAESETVDGAPAPPPTKKTWVMNHRVWHTREDNQQMPQAYLRQKLPSRTRCCLPSRSQSLQSRARGHTRGS